MVRPVIVVPIGDPFGIGPEIAVKAVRRPEVMSVCKPVLAGDLSAVTAAQQLAGDLTPVCRLDSNLSGFCEQSLNLLDVPGLDECPVCWGEISPAAGRAAYRYIEASCRACLAGSAAAMATAPIHKESLRAAGVEHIGHTEVLAALCRAAEPLTMFQTGNLRVFFFSRHVSLRQACDLIDRRRLAAFIGKCHRAMNFLGFPSPRLAVAGLNPHAGEHGLFGDEEVLHIAPAVEDARREGLTVSGPVAADSVFHLAASGRFDAVISLYHDQGHIAAKTLDFERTVALTLNLPFLRTSVDHGTAFDIAGHNAASPVSMIEAIRVAAAYCRRA
ncbi:MAG: 4-hydroxythreonine-4-phosphate dehydrogenase PdxA [Negativicutes bacterium]|nr:4-hydroxythreonine-4-phosphate dehydrogenase PdxA [Negativicutes bacterium]